MPGDLVEHCLIEVSKLIEKPSDLVYNRLIALVLD